MLIEYIKNIIIIVLIYLIINKYKNNHKIIENVIDTNLTSTDEEKKLAIYNFNELSKKIINGDTLTLPFDVKFTNNITVKNLIVDNSINNIKEFSAKNNITACRDQAIFGNKTTIDSNQQAGSYILLKQDNKKIFGFYSLWDYGNSNLSSRIGIYDEDEGPVWPTYIGNGKAKFGKAKIGKFDNHNHRYGFSHTLHHRDADGAIRFYDNNMNINSNTGQGVYFRYNDEPYTGNLQSNSVSIPKFTNIILKQANIQIKSKYHGYSGNYCYDLGSYGKKSCTGSQENKDYTVARVYDA